MIGTALGAVYGFLSYCGCEDYALLAGSVGLFAMLTLVMLLTRRVNWYDLKLGTPDSPSEGGSHKREVCGARSYKVSSDLLFFCKKR